MNEMLLQVVDQVALITFNRPHRLNAFRRLMFRQLLDLLKTIAHDDTIRVVVLTGAGRAFSAGIDLEEVAQLFDGSLNENQARAQLQEMQSLTRSMVALPQPIIAAINGVAVGVGAELAIASDIRIAAESASFAFAEVQRGLFETNGVMHRLPRLVGMGRAAQLLLTGEQLWAPAALEIGLVTQVVPPDELTARALELAHTLAANAPISMRLVKQVLQQAYDHDLEAVMQLETEGMLTCLASADMREGVQAFLEKRPPRYTGR